MTRNDMRDFGAETALVTAAFFVRNAVVLIALSAASLIAFLN
jgi:hypothetical protein